MKCCWIEPAKRLPKTGFPVVVALTKPREYDIAAYDIEGDLSYPWDNGHEMLAASRVIAWLDGLVPYEN